MKYPVANLDLHNYAALASQVWSAVSGIAVCDVSGLLLQASDSGTETLIQSSAKSMVDWQRRIQSNAVFDIDDGHAAISRPLHCGTGEHALYLVWVLERDRMRSDTTDDDVDGRILPIASSMQNDLQLNLELDSMAAELSARYDELNLVFNAANHIHYFQEGYNALRTLVQDCSSYLNVGFVALYLPGQRIGLGSKPRHANMDEKVLMDFVRNKILQAVSAAGESVLLNNEGTCVPSPQLSNQHYRVLACPVYGASDKIDGVLCIFNPPASKVFSNSDRNLLEVMSKRAAQILQGSYDGLSGFMNRASFVRLLEAQRMLPSEDLDARFVLFVNIDGLHRVNDTLGRDVGDFVIVSVMRTLHRELGKARQLARIDGDDIAVLAKEPSVEAALRLAEHLCEVVSRSKFKWEREEISVTIRVGIAPLSENDAFGEECLRVAAVSCKIAKDNGGNRVQVYRMQDTQILEHEEGLWMVAEVQKALRQDRFMLFAQTIKPLKPSFPVHVEVLLRLRDQKGGILTPFKFLPACERYGLMVEVDKWVLDKVLRTCGPWFKSGEQDLVVSINFSGHSFGNENFRRYAVAAIEKSGVPPKNICIEITETAAVGSLSQARKLIAELRRLGCRIALDDFGAGMSSFGYLKSFNVQYLKIDGSLIKDIETDAMSKAMVSSINQIGHALGLQTIAEFVENGEIQTILNTMGVDFVQGYHIDKPMPLDELYRKHQQKETLAEV